MRRLVTYSSVVLLLACATSRTGRSAIPGTYDLVSFGGESLPTAGISRLWLEVTPQGTWRMFEEPGSRFGGTRGLYAMSDTVDACYVVNLWPESNPAVRAPFEVCPNDPEGLAYLVPAWISDLDLEEPLVFQRRR